MSIVKSFSFPEGDIRGDMFYIKHGSNNFTSKYLHIFVKMPYFQHFLYVID